MWNRKTGELASPVYAPTNINQSLITNICYSLVIQKGGTGLKYFNKSNKKKMEKKALLNL